MSEIAHTESHPDLSKLDQKLINHGWVRWAWLPYWVALVGIGLSVFVSIIFHMHLQDYFDILRSIKSYLPWLALISGYAFSITLAYLIRAAQVTRIQAAYLAEVNAELKKEIHDSAIMRESKTKLEQALLQGQKLQAMGTLAGGIAHDFNNLLYAIIGYTEMAREDVNKDSQLHQNLGKVLEGCHRGQELVARILTFSRRQHYQLDELDLRPTIENVLSLLQQTVPASVMIQFEMKDDIKIVGNKTLLHQVMVNIINNAVDAMDGEGTININVTRIAKGDPYLHQFPDIADQSYSKIEITDTGHGMDQETMNRIFEPFYTTKDVGKGTGLGLSIVHSIIKEHKGEVAVTSELGKGTTFTLLMPEFQQS